MIRREAARGVCYTMAMIDITQLKPGQSGTIAEVRGGHILLHRVAVLGIRPGKKIKKISSSFMRGPQTIEVGRSRVALGFGMAKHILVKAGHGPR